MGSSAITASKAARSRGTGSGLLPAVAATCEAGLGSSAKQAPKTRRGHRRGCSSVRASPIVELLRDHGLQSLTTRIERGALISCREENPTLRHNVVAVLLQWLVAKKRSARSLPTSHPRTRRGVERSAS